eukprot:9503804-Pyramimonas_sp.AAC.3
MMPQAAGQAKLKQLAVLGVSPRPKALAQGDPRPSLKALGHEAPSTHALGPRPRPDVTASAQAGPKADLGPRPMAWPRALGPRA